MLDNRRHWRNRIGLGGRLDVVGPLTMTLRLPKGCAHTASEMDVAANADGLCPICLATEIERLRAALTEACNIALGTDLTREVAERVRALRNEQTAAPTYVEGEISKAYDSGWRPDGFGGKPLKGV
jgi:hypothetical protein